jgi:hypothetical protein
MSVVYAKFNTSHSQQHPPNVFHDKPTRYNISYKRHHKKIINKVYVKRNQLLEHKIERNIVNNTCIKLFDNAKENDIDTIFEDIDDLVVIINARIFPLDF